MREVQRPRAGQILDDIFKAYAVSADYSLMREVPKSGVSDTEFASHRRNQISPLVAISDWESSRKERDSFMFEWMTMLGFKNILERLELKIELAPSYLEIGYDERKGVDLIISKDIPGDSKSFPIFAINVKLKRLKERRTEIYKYDKILGCPAIELSLGDFSLQTRESVETSPVFWLRQIATPNITNSGKIPYFYKWREYLIHRATETLSHYMIKTDDFLQGGYKPSDHESNLFPKEKNEFERFYENLTFSYMLFRKLDEEVIVV